MGNIPRGLAVRGEVLKKLAPSGYHAVVGKFGVCARCLATTTKQAGRDGRGKGEIKKKRSVKIELINI